MAPGRLAWQPPFALSPHSVLTEPVDVFTDWLDHIEEENAAIAAAGAAAES